jgi:hypothetical protein
MHILVSYLRFFAIQLNALYQAKLIKAGAFLLPKAPSTPGVTAKLLAKDFDGSWQVPQLTVLLADKIGSKNNFFPNATPTLVTGFSGSGRHIRKI